MRAFHDTNVLVYAFVNDGRGLVARALLQEGGVISVQCLNEFTDVASRKLRLDWEEIDTAVAYIRSLCDVTAVDVLTYEVAAVLARRHRLRILDALILGAALKAGCDTLWSEDMHGGLVLEGRLTIRNPFSGAH